MQNTVQQILDELKEIRSEQGRFSDDLKEIKSEQGKFSDELKDVKEEQSSLREDMNAGFARLEKKLDRHRIENINADNLLLNEIRTVREDVFFVNRKIADTELDLHTLKQQNKSSI